VYRYRWRSRRRGIGRAVRPQCPGRGVLDFAPNSGCIPLGAAVRPIRAGVAGGKVFVRKKHDLAAKTALRRKVVDAIAQVVELGVGHADDDARLLAQALQRFDDQRLDLRLPMPPGEGGEQLAHQGQRNFEGFAGPLFGSAPQLRAQLLKTLAQPVERVGISLRSRCRRLGAASFQPFGMPDAVAFISRGVEVFLRERRGFRFRLRLFPDSRTCALAKHRT
jgi:hypothetical protein